VEGTANYDMTLVKTADSETEFLKRSASLYPDVPKLPNSETEISFIKSEPHNFNGVHCPRCRSQKLQTIVETNTNVKGGGFGAGKGCLGFLLFGPLGILCGACGSRVKATTTNKTFLMCMDCGNKFREANGLAEEKSEKSKSYYVGGAIAIIVGVILLSNGETGFGLAAAVVGGICILVGFGEKKESEEIKTRKYEAEYYKNQKE
jgi:DNA-directed RNA polymerase subunit RPC12/RpoP